ncbi:MAG: cupin domain-containing protein [Kangiellaceae bacterium]|nr:cupin domain-containing protein [Kangiellaceae bacterium]
MPRHEKDEVIDITEKFTLFSEHWRPKVIAEMNDYQFKLAKLKGEFDWHSHQDTDEVFVVLKGELEMHLRDKVLKLPQGSLYVVKKGVEHKPVAQNECEVMLVEPRGVVNTGDDSEKTALTAPNDVWI